MASGVDTKKIETVLAQMLEPVKGIPFPLVMRILAKQEVHTFDVSQSEDETLLANLKEAINICITALNDNPIERPRANEVGNDIEQYVMRAVNEVGLKCSRPTTRDGAGRAVGYPDLLVRDESDRAIYLECKTVGSGKLDTAFRSFYLSPSKSFKVTEDGLHLLLAFEMRKEGGSKAGLEKYLPVAYKVADLSKLDCDVKYEINSNNRRLYSQGTAILNEQC